MSVVERFRALHHAGEILLMPNAWDVGSARILAHLGFPALATTSGGAAAARGLTDGGMDRDAVLAHAAALVAAVDVPVSADLEDCWPTAPDGVAGTIWAVRRPLISSWSRRCGATDVGCQQWRMADIPRSRSRVSPGRRPPGRSRRPGRPRPRRGWSR